MGVLGWGTTRLNLQDLGMKCLFYFGITYMKEDTSAQLSGRGELHGGARVITLVTLRKCTLSFKREIKTLKEVLALTKVF